LCSLETDEGDHGENKREKRADDLQVALKNGVGLKSDVAKPGSARTTKRKTAKCAKNMVVLLRRIVRGAWPWVYRNLVFVLQAERLLN